MTVILNYLKEDLKIKNTSNNLPTQAKVATTENKTQTIEPQNDNFKTHSKVEDKKSSYGVSISGVHKIKDAIKDKLAQNKNDNTIVPITDENLMENWGNKCEEIIKERNFLKETLKEVTLSFENNLIKIAAPTVAYDFLKPKRLELLSFFKDAYQNEEINVLIIEKLLEDKNDGKTILTNRDIYEQMIQKNPVLKELKEKFGMDFEL